MIAHAWRYPVAHLTPAHEIGHELEPFAVPGVQIGARRRLAINLGNLKHGEKPTRFRVSNFGLCLNDAGRPQQTHSVRAGAFGEAEDYVGGARSRSGCIGLELLFETSGADFYLGSGRASIADPTGQLQ